MAKIDFAKGASSIKNVASKAGEKISGVAKDSAQALQDKKQEFTEKTQAKMYESRMKKYNPLFPEKYSETQFNLPNMVRIVDSS